MGEPPSRLARPANVDDLKLLLRALNEHGVDYLMEVVGLREGHDDAERNYRQTRQLLAQHADLVGIYNIGGASDGVGRPLKEAGRDRKVVFVGHGLSPDTRGLLIDGTMDAVITQDPQSMVASCVRIFANLRERREVLAGVEPARISLVLRENLPA